MSKLPLAPSNGEMLIMINGKCVGAVGVAGISHHMDVKIAENTISLFQNNSREHK